MDESKRERAQKRLLGLKTLNVFLGSLQKNERKKPLERRRRGKDNVDDENDADDENDDSR